MSTLIARCRSAKPTGAAILLMVTVALAMSVTSRAVALQPPAAPPTPAEADAPPPTEEMQRLMRAQATLRNGEAVSPEHQQAVGLYDAALQHLREAQKFEAQADRLRSEITRVPDEVAEVDAALADPSAPGVDLPPDVTLEQLRAKLTEAQAQLRAAQERVESLQGELPRRTQRRAAVPTQLATLREQLADVEAEMLVPVPADEHPDVRAATLEERAARQQQLRAEIAALEAELANLEARDVLLPKRIELWSARAVAAQAAVDELRERVNRAEAAKAQREAQQALQEAETAPEPLREVREEIAQLAGELAGPDGVLARRQRAENDLNALRREVEALRSRFERSLNRAQTIGVDERLRIERQNLPDLRALHARMTRLRERLEAAEMRREELDLAREELPALHEHPGAMLDLREKYSTLLLAYGDSIEALSDTLDQLQVLADLTLDYRTFIDERVLWIRSAPPIDAGVLRAAWPTARWLVSPAHWIATGKAVWVTVRSNPFGVALGVALLAALLLVRVRAASRMDLLAKQVAYVSTDGIVRTFEAMAITVVLAATWPAVLWFAAWLLREAAGDAEFPHMLSAALTRTGVLLLALELLRQIARPNGLGEAHFRWQPRPLGAVRRTVTWFAPAVLPFVFIVAGMEAITGGAGREPLGRLAFIAAMLLLAIAIARIMRPDGGVLDGVLRNRRGGWLDRLRYMWYPALIATPLVLAILAAAGFYYTALQLHFSLVKTYWLILILVVAHGLVLRWLMQARRRVAMAEARKRREAMLAEQAKRDSAAAAAPAGQVTASESGPVALDEPRIDLQDIGEQTQQLVSSVLAFSAILGLWLIWSGMLPALNVLDRVILYPEFGIAPEHIVTDYGPSLVPADTITAPPAAPPPPPADGQAPAAEPPAATPATPATPLNFLTTPTASTPEAATDVVTLGNAILAVLVLIITYIVGKNLPGILEITILQRLPLEPSGRYAFATVARYVIVIIGLVVAFNNIGIGWSKVQWLAAAITVGLGFGLQEIFANFVSGLIILFERPIRVGDTVTIGDISGTVSRIRIRATTITDWDRKELVIPNKEFVTGQVINWTLSDPTLRITIPVGVAYGSDVALAKRLILQVARDNPLVLKEPKPAALFLGFGDSTLNLELRAFIPSIDNLLAAKDQLHDAIDAAFRANDVEIAFPQRDLHIRSIASELRDAIRPATAPPTPDGH